MKQLPLPVQLRASSVFSSFFVGPNAIVVAQLKSLRPNRRPLVVWICGAEGTGKTHLLQAICAEAGRQGQSAAYIPAATDGITSEALQGCDSLDFVCLDDFERLAGNSTWEKAVFRLYTELEESGGLLIVAADLPPSGLSISLKDLASRLAAGTILRLQALSEDQQTEALIFRAQQLGLELPGEVSQYLLRRLPRDMATLCDTLDKLDRASLATQRKLTIPFVRDTLGEPSTL